MEASNGSTVEVLYDLEYPVKGGRTVSIVQGEFLYLIKKTNQDWWQVIRSGERRPFYVPSTYVKESSVGNYVGSGGGSNKRSVISSGSLSVDKSSDTRGGYSRVVPMVVRGRKSSVEPGEANILDSGDSGESQQQLSRSLTELARQIAFRPRAAANGTASSAGSGSTTVTVRPVGGSERRCWERKLDGLRKAGSFKSPLKRGVTAGGIEDGGVDRGRLSLRTTRQLSGSWPDIRSTLGSSGGVSPGGSTTVSEVRVAADKSNNNYASDCSETTATLSSTESIDPPAGYRPVAKPRLHIQQSHVGPGQQPNEVIYANCLELAREAAAKKKAPSSNGSGSRPPSREQLPGSMEMLPTILHHSGITGHGSSERLSLGKEKDGSGCSDSGGDSDSAVISSVVMVPQNSGSSAASRVVPQGWTTHVDTETQLPCYIHHSSSQKWYSSVDSEGREYFFEENSGESSWSLPELSDSGAGVATTTSTSGFVEEEEDEDDTDQVTVTSSSNINNCNSRSTTIVPVTTSSSNTMSSHTDIVSAATKTEDIMTSSIDTSQISEELSAVLQKISSSGVDHTRKLRNVKAFSMIVPDKRSEEELNVNKNWPQLSEGKMFVICEGPLQYTKISEGGKKVRKSWTPVYVVLTELFILVYKDIKAFHNLKTPPECTIDLNGADVGSGESVSGRKHVLVVQTQLGHRVALQCDNVNSALHWATNIQHTIQNLVSITLPKATEVTAIAHHMGERGGGIGGGVAVLPPIGGIKVFSGQVGDCPEEQPKKASSGIGRSKSVNFKCKDGDSLEELGGATPQERQMKIRARLKKFFNKRPTMESLVKKGIWKDEPVFGCYLEQACGSNIPRIPPFVQKCIAVIESSQENMKTDGLYRASGNLSQIQKIRFQIDQHNYNCLEQEEDVHVLTGALKLFFRELKEPLIPYKLFQKAIKASTTSSKKEKQNLFHDIVKALPTPNKDTLKFLLQHLLRVTQYQESNRMHVANVAIVFGPTLMWPEVESANMALDMMQQNMVIEALLNNFNTIFK